MVREYVGAGPDAELIAQWDALQRARRESAAADRRAERARLEAADRPLAELCEATDLLARGVLLLAGYHQHHGGEWRRRRGQLGEGGKRA